MKPTSLARVFSLLPLCLCLCGIACSSSDSASGAGAAGATNGSSDPVVSKFYSCDYAVVLSGEGAAKRVTQEHCSEAESGERSLGFPLSMPKADCAHFNDAPDVAPGFSTTRHCPTDVPGCACASDFSGDHYRGCTYASTLGEQFDAAKFKETCDLQNGTTTCFGGVETP